MAPKKKLSPYSEDAMKAAIHDVLNNKLSKSAASKKYNIPRSTLKDRISGKYEEGRGRSPFLTKEEENALVE